MNERIKQLAEQAIKEKLSLDEFVQAIKDEPYDFWGFRQSELTEFVQLIEEAAEKKYFSAGYIAGQSDGISETVRACVDIVNGLSQHQGPGDCSTAEYIREHFGVEQ